MVQLQEYLAEISATGTQLVAVSYDSVELLQKYSETKGIEFPLLSDTDSETIRAFGIYHKDGYPYPGTYIIGPGRKILAARFLEGYLERHSPEDLIEMIGNIKK